MMALPENVEVQCLDGSSVGWSTGVVINPSTGRIIDLIVKEKMSPHTLRLVPVEHVLGSTPQRIELGCAAADFARMAPFVKAEFMEVDIPHYLGDGYVCPCFIAESETAIATAEQISPEELAIRKGAKVEASDGPVGQVDGFLIEPANGFITHLVLQRDHLWGRRVVTIPVSKINYFSDERVYLKLDKQGIADLPDIPVKPWGGQIHPAYYPKYPNSTIDLTSAVDEAEWESFPASDPPAWTSGRRG